MIAAWLLVIALGSVGTVLQSGVATWYDAPSPQDAAAGPALRVGDWRGSWVVVRAGDRSVTVRLTDHCWCVDRNGRDTLLDLDDVAFSRLAPLSAGVVAVTVESGGFALPETDTGP
jgi:hypothetical protein